jgi:hypothetical protein
MKEVIGILLLVCIVIATIYMTNSHKDDGRAGSKKAETLKINADGTMTLESIKEDFMRIENEYEQTYGLDDHIHLRYWTNKATRFSIWAGMSDVSNEEKAILKAIPCDAPDCVIVDTANAVATSALLNDVIESTKPGLKDYNNYFESAGIIKADYKRIVLSGGSREEKETGDNREMGFDILFKGYLEYKNISVPPEINYGNHSESAFYKDIVKTVPVVSQWMMIHEILRGKFFLTNSDGKISLALNKHPANMTTIVKFRVGIDIHLIISILIINIIKMIMENKEISFIYDPPPNMQSYNTINELFSGHLEYV